VKAGRLGVGLDVLVVEFVVEEAHEWSLYSLD
jgi:hypothetical protein